MTYSEYKAFVKELGSDKPKTEDDRISWAILEMNSESNECLDIVTKHVRKDTPIDKAKLWDELCDTFWGFTAVMNEAFPNQTLEDVMKYNRAKLMERHNNGIRYNKASV